jgi:sterol desaturase/sphingolipid hydroxylase (fatty acid hydroxylase superfamily)
MLFPKKREECKSNKNHVVGFYTVITSIFTLYGVSKNNLSLGEWFIALIIGYLLWAFTEYALHRFTFHTNLPNMRWNYLTYKLHVYHHGNTNDKPYIPVPILLSLPVYIIIVGICYMLSPDFVYTCAIITSFGFSYVFFEVIHWRCHDENAKGKITQMFREYHNHHHFISSKHNYGVVSPIADIIFGTRAKKQ